MIKALSSLEVKCYKLMCDTDTVNVDVLLFYPYVLILPPDPFINRHWSQLNDYIANNPFQF